jgi:hypothetical protein
MLEHRIAERFEAWIAMQWIQPRIDPDCTDIIAVAQQPTQFTFWGDNPFRQSESSPLI